ncbi:MAG: GNAT family N-acetyltransferase [Planctomycetaceae bacterium]|nr:GNAT family N-acetyltransferase [Planctomycetaceae bacterium]
MNLTPALTRKLAPEQPLLKTQRLVLRPLALDDAPTVERLAGEKDIASTTRLIPHPYPPGMAEHWIGSLPELYAKAEMINWGIVLDGGLLLGTIRLTLNPVDNHAEMGYWVGKPYWNNGYCTEAARAVVGFGFDKLDLERVYANYMARNPASGRVLAKLGMIQEGLLRRHRRKFGRYEDLIVCGITRAEWQAHKRQMATASREPSSPASPQSTPAELPPKICGDDG